MTSSEQHEAQSSPQTVAESSAFGERQGGVEIRLPFLTITRGGHPVPEGGPAGPTSGGGNRSRLEELAFYGGAAALAAFGLIDWPVAALVAAGTFIARKSRGLSGQPPGDAGASSVPHGGKRKEERRQTTRARTSSRGSRTTQ
jgi:hypothetical protein